jgi:hypothetical protein
MDEIVSNLEKDIHIAQQVGDTQKVLLLESILSITKNNRMAP